MRSQDHRMQLFLDPKLRLALIKLQAQLELGQPYAGLYALNEGLHSLNFLGDKDYRDFKKRYSEKLVPQEQADAEIDPQAQREIESMTHYFKEILAQWDGLRDIQW